MRPLFLAFVAVFPAIAQDFTFSPSPIHQGETLKLRSIAEAVQARMNGITIPLFTEPDGVASGLMPVGVEQEPGEYKLEFLNSSGAIIHEITVAVEDAHYPKQNIVIAPELSALRASSDEAARVHAFLTSVSPTRFWKEPLQAPVPGCMNSPFGASRLHNGKPTGDYHGGVDQRGAPGTPIHAVAAGTVRIVHMFQLRGGTVAIDHGQGLETIYMHMSRFAATEGQQVEAGDVIGYVGSTGRATGPHLHWSLYANGHPVSPRQWVKLTPCGAVRPKARPRTTSKR
ncbi:MAG TPA: M23 family metallopeptidase [Bryobacteraceae bacterium]|jgi:murein DD-endopeptidase MepM/ murein hydrolase activator NlpD